MTSEHGMRARRLNGEPESAADPAAIATQLNRVFYAVDYMSNLEGQDAVLVIEMSQAMLNDVIEGHGLKPMAEYVKRFCDVLDSEADAERIASEL
jgi:hypothetical protein